MERQSAASSSGWLETVRVRLEEAYGRPNQLERRDPLDELVLTILSQHTSDVNSRRAFSNCKALFRNWQDVLAASPSELQDAIKTAGLSQIKSARIRAVLERTPRSMAGSIFLTFPRLL